MEEPFSHIQDRYLKHFNSHAKGYMWKRLGLLVDMAGTLESNGMHDDDDRLVKAGMDDTEWIPAIHIYFSDDLTVA